ncbi:hypothetical protein [Dyella psychrodurans]|uniref:Uncharacterized protein n=1 Tax=Dyella psychrodurans TaxID=1927960 RepID=A0A370X4N8_9GAMM|nr:hypothetical protein [Dyella psychrodurans]RDS83316.1 hypothetical protein DWU99_12285 [Dyella psychrodurans]
MNSQPAMPARSTFVTVLAWIFIGFTGFASLISLMQNLMLQLIFVPLMQQQHVPMSQNLPPGMPVQMGWMFDHLFWMFRIFLLLSLSVLTASIGLLLRKEWARKLFIGLMAFGILYQIGGLFFQWWYMSAVFDHFPMPPNPKPDVEQMMQVMRGFMNVIRIFTMLMSVGISILLGWIIKKLVSAPIRQEFAPVLASTTITGNSP